MAAINKQVLNTSIHSTNDFLVFDELQPDGTYVTKKITPFNAGFGSNVPGPAGTPAVPLGFTPENVANKSNDGRMSANSATLYTTQSAVITYVDRLLGSLDNTVVEFFDDYSLGAISTFDRGLGFLADGVGTGCTIANKTQADGRTHQRLVLSNGQYGRPLPWGKFWNRMKIFILWRLDHNASFTSDGYIGVCNGTTNMVASATTNNFIGIRWGDGLSTSTFTAGTKINYFDTGVGYRFHSRRGTTSTSIGAGGSGHTISADEGHLSGILYEVSRPVFLNDSSSVTYTHKEVSPPSTFVEFSRGKDLVRKVLNSFSTSIVSMSEAETATVGTAGNGTGAFDQSTGGLDTVNVSWPFATGLEIAAIGITKLH